MKELYQDLRDSEKDFEIALNHFNNSDISNFDKVNMSLTYALNKYNKARKALNMGVYII